MKKIFIILLTICLVACSNGITSPESIEIQDNNETQNNTEYKNRQGTDFNLFINGKDYSYLDTMLYDSPVDFEEGSSNFPSFPKIYGQFKEYKVYGIYSENNKPAYQAIENGDIGDFPLYVTKQIDANGYTWIMYFTYKENQHSIFEIFLTPIDYNKQVNVWPICYLLKYESVAYHPYTIESNISIIYDFTNNKINDLWYDEFTLSAIRCEWEDGTHEGKTYREEDDWLQKKDVYLVPLMRMGGLSIEGLTQTSTYLDKRLKEQQ